MSALDQIWRYGRLAVLTLLAAAVLNTCWLEPDSLRVTRYSLPLRHCPPALAGLRIAVLADLHAGAPFMDLDKLRQVVATTNATQPDMVLIAGDIFVQFVLGGHRLPPGDVAEVLGQLHAPLGVYAVLGNHDYSEQPRFQPERYQQLLKQNGIVPIDNVAMPLSGANRHFWIAGFGDLHHGHPDVVRTLGDVPEGEPVIALTHEPDLFPDVPSRVNLVVAGHTHGGQVRLPFIGRPVVPSDFGQRYAAGHVVEQTDLFVTTGIGTSHLPVRFGVPPEISLLTLQPRAP